MMSIKELRKKYSEFVYNKYLYSLEKNDLKICFEFIINPNINFKPTLLIKNIDKKRFESLDREVIDNLVFHLGLMEIPSYWKATCSPVINIKAGKLNNNQIIWWKDLFLKGMGQFYYENNIDFKDGYFLKIVACEDIQAKKGLVLSEKVLVPVGGGKDSSVTLNLIRANYKRFGTLMLNHIVASENIINKINADENVLVERTIDEKLLKLNSEGYLNGHTPFSAYLAFLSILVGYLFDYKNIAFSNERSANEGNVEYLNCDINHQYSKSVEFENRFREYNEKHLSNINYFSFLRPLYEIQISRIFSKYQKYFSIIRSCNIGQKTNSWCLKCPKCLSSFILLYPFLGPEKIKLIFKKDLYFDDDLYPVLQKLVDDKMIKPFECVGTREEIRLGLYLSLKYYKNNNLPVLLFKSNTKYLKHEKDLELRADNVLKSWDANNNLNDDFKKILERELSS